MALKSPVSIFSLWNQKFLARNEIERLFAEHPCLEVFTSVSYLKTTLSCQKMLNNHHETTEATFVANVVNSRGFLSLRWSHCRDPCKP